MNIINIISDPVRRRILEVITENEKSAGRIVEIVGGEFKISQPAISQHLKVLRTNELAKVRIKASKRLYSINPDPLREIDIWLSQFRKFWENKLNDLEKEIEFGKRQK